MNFLLAIIVASQLTTSELMAKYPDPCEVEGQVFHTFLEDRHLKALTRNDGPIGAKYDNRFFGEIAALAPVKAGPEVWVYMQLCPGNSSHHRALFEDESLARAALPVLFKKQLDFVGFYRRMVRDRHAGFGGYEIAKKRMKAARDALSGPLDGKLLQIEVVAEDGLGAGCLCKQIRG